MTPIRKVSSFQITIAAMILSGQRVIYRDTIGCGQLSWKTLRASAKLRWLDPAYSGVTDEAMEWAKAVQDHQERVRDRRRYRPQEATARKIRRAMAIAGVPRP